MAEPAVKELESKEHNLEIQWVSFELLPEPIPTLDPNGDYLVSAWQNHVYPLAANMNMPLKRPPIQPRSRLAHEAVKWADKYGCFESYHLALFRTFFELGKNIGNIEILKELADDLNLDADELETSLKTNEFTKMVLSDENKAKLLGVLAVPAFVVNGNLKAAGVQSAKRLHELLTNNPLSLKKSPSF